ncbi:MAG: phosphopantetheine-binding protein, partial [Gammaproteobacteria bacterium]
KTFVGILDSLIANPEGRLGTLLLRVPRLPAPSPASNVATSGSPPATPTEATIAEVVAEVLQVESVDVEGNFFDLGARSLSLLEIHHRLQQRLQRTFPIVTLFQHVSVRQLAGFLEGGASQSTDMAPGARAASQRAALAARRRKNSRRSDMGARS